MTSHDPDFWERAAAAFGLYLNPPENGIVYSIDAKPGMQSKSPAHPQSRLSGHTRRQEREYKRHGTAALYPALDVHDGASTDGWRT